MPGLVLHSGATVLCAHAGQATLTAPEPRVLVGGQPVATVGAPYVVTGCALEPVACVTAQWTSGATRVLAGGRPVATVGGASTCAPTGTPLLPVATQTRVSAG